jgi:hypothetical protein
MKSALILATAICLSTTSAFADESMCGVTTHGIPLKTKAAAIDWKGNPDKLFAALGPGQLHTQRDGAGIVVWYDIKHIRTGTPQNSAGTDCGVMLTLSTKSQEQTLTMKSLLAADIDLLLSGKVPNF